MRRALAATMLFLLTASMAQAAGEKPSADALKRGEMLTAFGGCHDCHTPKQFGPEGMTFDMTRMLSGAQAGQQLPPVDKKALTPGYWIVSGRARRCGVEVRRRAVLPTSFPGRS